MVDFICMGLIELQGPQSKREIKKKKENPYPQWDSNTHLPLTKQLHHRLRNEINFSYSINPLSYDFVSILYQTLEFTFTSDQCLVNLALNTCTLLSRYSISTVSRRYRVRIPASPSVLYLQLQGQGLKMFNITWEAAEQTTLPKYRGILSTLRLIVKEEGIRSVYNGISPGLQRQMCFSVVKLGLYDEVKMKYTNLFYGGICTFILGKNLSMNKFDEFCLKCCDKNIITPTTVRWHNLQIAIIYVTISK